MRLGFLFLLTSDIFLASCLILISGTPPGPVRFPTVTRLFFRVGGLVWIGIREFMATLHTILLWGCEWCPTIRTIFQNHISLLLLFNMPILT